MKRLLTLATLAVLAAGAAHADAPREHKPPLRKGAMAMAPAKLDSVHSFDVKSYTFWISVPMTNDSLYGRVRLGATAVAGPLTAVKLNAVDLTIDSVTCDGAPAAYLAGADTLTITVPGIAAGSHFTIDIRYRLGNRASRIGYYWYQRDGSSMGRHNVGYSMAEPQDARSWTPCFDEQWDKADSGCEFFVTVPDSYAVASNGMLQDTARGGGKMTWHWKEPIPVSTYLMCFTASRYARWSDTAYTADGDTIPLNYFIWPEDSAQSRAVFATVPGMIQCYAARYHRYPFDKYGMAAVSPFDYGGMEHQTMTTIHEYWIPYNDQYGIAHELSHQWFGDMITCGTWGDIWLNEGFASYSEALYYEYINPGTVPGTYMVNNFSSALSGNANTYPIYNEPMDLVFDESMEYAKGAWVLQNLRGVMGDSAFFAGMQAYCDTFAYGNAVTAEFQRIMEHSYGQPLDWFFNEWVYRAGHPSYATAIYYRTHPDSLAAVVRIKQTSTTGELYKMPLQLACSTATGISSVTTAWDSLARQGFTVGSAQPIRRIMVDPDNWVLKGLSDSKPNLIKVVKGVRMLTPVWNKFRADSAGIAGYNLYRSGAVSGPFARINGAILTDTVYADTGLTPNVMQYYAVTAVCLEDTNSETRFSNVTGQKPLSGVEGGPAVPLPAMTMLENGRPNPFSGTVAIGYQLAQPGRVSLKVYNAAGQQVKTLVDAEQPAGRHTAGWDGRDARGRRVAAGIYYCRLDAGGIQQTRALQYIK